MRMLLAIDQSKDSKATIHVLQKLKWPTGSILIVLHVLPLENQMAPAREGRSSQKNLSDTGNSSISIQAALDQVKKQLGSTMLQVETMVVKGIPGQEILNLIQKKKIDVAVLGSRGLSRISGLLIGSVSEWVLNDARCSVLIGRPTARKAKFSSSFKVLLATDGSPDSWNAVDILKEIGLPAGSMVTVLHVIRKHLYETEQCVHRAGMSQAEFAKMTKDLCRDRGSVGVALLKETRNALSSFSFQVDECLALGHEAQEILKMARRQKADLILVGSTGKTGLRKVFMGSVAHTVSRHAPCSVLVVRGAKKSSRG